MVASYDPSLGYVAVAGVLTQTDVDMVLGECARLLTLPEEERNPRDKIEHGTHHLFDLANRSAVIEEVVGRYALLDEVAAIVGPGFSPTEVSYRCPQPGFGGQKLHADDVPKLDRGPDRVATAIVALVDFTSGNGSTRVVPGSHSRPDLQRQAGSLERHPDELQLIGPAGTAFVFSGHLLHSGSVNQSNAERPALQLTWRA